MCVFCSKTFTQKGNLAKHLKTVHKKEVKKRCVKAFIKDLSLLNKEPKEEELSQSTSEKEEIISHKS